MLSHARPSHAYAVPDQSYRLNDHERLRQARFEAALNEGFYVRARERMIYLSVRSDPDDSMGWMIHRFVTPDGRLMGIRLPANAQIYVWPVGKGPTPHDSIACCGAPWGRVPADTAFQNQSPLCLKRRMHSLWRRAACSDDLGMPRLPDPLS